MFAYYADARKLKLPTFLTDHSKVRPPAVSACNANTLVNINNQNDKYKWKRSGEETSIAGRQPGDTCLLLQTLYIANPSSPQLPPAKSSPTGR